MNVVITGATKGIGRAIAERFAVAGFDLIVCSRQQADLEQMKAAIEKQYSITCNIFVCDMSKRESLQGFINYIQKNFKQVDVLVNNAGIFKPGSIATEVEGTLEELFSVNVASAYHLTRGLLPLLKGGTKSHIFNVCSIASITAYSNGGSYAITKHAMLGLTRNLRAETKADGIRVTAVMPGATYSESWKSTPLPEARFMPTKDIAEMIFSAYSLSANSVVEEIIIRPMQGDIREEEFG